MFELLAAAIGLTVSLAVVLTVLLVVGGLVVLPLLLLLSVMGFTVRLAAGTIGLVVGGLVLVPLGLLLVPVVAFVGGLLLLKLAILAAPLLLVGLAVWALVSLTRTPKALPAAQVSSVSPVSEASARRT